MQLGSSRSRDPSLKVPLEGDSLWLGRTSAPSVVSLFSRLAAPEFEMAGPIRLALTRAHIRNVRRSMRQVDKRAETANRVHKSEQEYASIDRALLFIAPNQKQPERKYARQLEMTGTLERRTTFTTILPSLWVNLRIFGRTNGTCWPINRGLRVCCTLARRRNFVRYYFGSGSPVSHLFPFCSFACSVTCARTPLFYRPFGP